MCNEDLYGTKFEDVPNNVLDRDIFCSIFSNIDMFLGDYLPGYENEEIRIWLNDDTVYMMHKPSLTVVTYYKLGHIGRANECNKELTVDEYKLFAKILEESILEHTDYRFVNYTDLLNNKK